MKAQTFKQFVINENSQYFRNGISEFEITLTYTQVDEQEFPKTDEVFRKVSQADAADREALAKLGLNDPGKEIEYSKLDSVKFFYDMEAEFGSAGLEGVIAVMKAVQILGYYEIWDEKTDSSITEYFEIEMDAATCAENVSFNYDKSIPLEPTYAEIDFNGGINPANIKIRVTIG